ncbi:MAG: flagellar motor protein MotB [bacterium]
MKLSVDSIRKLIRRRLFEAQEQDVDPNMWMIPYVNLMTILMIFFLILYAFNNLNKTAYEKTILTIKANVADKEEQAKKIKELESISNFEKYIWNNRLNKFIELALDTQKVIITLREPILFDKGKAELKDTAFDHLREVAEFIKNTPGKVNVEGHTDDLPIRTGEYKNNWELAAARAYSIVEHFTGEAYKDPVTGEAYFNPGRFSILSFSYFQPVAVNDSDENRIKNRRIEITIKKDEPTIDKPTT